MTMQGGSPKKIKPPTCAGCGKSIGPTQPRTIINGNWHCAACTYRHDYPDKEVVPAKRPRSRPKQAETLFPLPPKKPDGAP